MAFFDKLKAKATELGLDEKAAQAKEKAAAAAGENRGKIADAVGKAGQAVDSKTGGKYSDKITKAQDAALKGVDKVAAQNGGAAGAAGTTTGSFGETAVGSETAYESGVQRTVGQDGLRTADDQAAGDSPVERAIGADATTSSLDAHTSFETGDAGARDVQNADVRNAPVTDPEINEIRRVGETPRD